MNIAMRILKFRHKKTANLAVIYLIFKMMVGAVGFEPTTPWSQTRCTTRLCYAPFVG